MPKAGERDLAKEQHWRRIFSDWKMSGLNAAEYCRRKDLKYTQFIDWGKRLRKRDAAQTTGTQYRNRMAARAKAIAKKLRLEESKEVEFAEVQLMDHGEPEVAQSVPRTLEDALLEVVFPSGTKLRIPPGSSTAMLASVVALLEGR